MKRFTVPVEFSAISYFEVEASNADEAENIVQTMLDNGEALLQEETEIMDDFEILTESISDDG